MFGGEGFSVRVIAEARHWQDVGKLFDLFDQEAEKIKNCCQHCGAELA